MPSSLPPCHRGGHFGLRPLSGHDNDRCLARLITLHRAQVFPFSRCGSHPSHRHVHQTKSRASRSPHRSSPENAGGRGRYAHDQSFKPRNVRKKKKGKRNADRRGSVSTALVCALQSALANRRSTTALCQWDYSSQGSTWARLRDTRGPRGGTPASPCGTSSDVHRTPVIVPAG